MKITQVKVQNFRSIKDETLLFDDLIILAGANGSGKSTFLKALDIFYSNTPSLDIDDFYNRDISKEVVIAVTFDCISEGSLEKFGKYIQNGQLTVECVCHWDDDKKKSEVTYHGSKIRHSGFDPVKSSAFKKADDKKEMYKKFQRLPEYSSLPNCNSVLTIMQALEEWENQNPDKCEMGRDDGNFFG